MAAIHNQWAFNCDVISWVLTPQECKIWCSQKYSGIPLKDTNGWGHLDNTKRPQYVSCLGVTQLSRSRMVWLPDILLSSNQAQLCQTKSGKQWYLNIGNSLYHEWIWLKATYIQVHTHSLVLLHPIMFTGAQSISSQVVPANQLTLVSYV